jgi:ABC-type polysaccharide/polyol phosphate transport system ATPase subunit
VNSPVIRVENLSKKYRLGVINRQMLVDQIESWVARKLGRSDPHASVFEKATDRMPTPFDFWALKDVSFEIEKGDVVGVMGRNGSGKSTLLKILSRITAPTTGKALLHGRLASLLEVGTGFNYELTGKENVFLNGSILGLKDREIRARYDRIVEFAEIADFMDTPVKRYSSGMRVRLAFAVAAHLDPDILILDEVLAVGDAKFQEKCLNRIDDIRGSGVTVLFVSHSSQLVSKLCTKGIVLSDGRVAATGLVNDAIQNYNRLLGLKVHDDLPEGLQEGNVGVFAGKLAALLLRELPGGSIATQIPLELQDKVFPIELGWVSESRLKTLRTEPTWTGSPDIAIQILSNSKSEAAAQQAIDDLMRAGATEVWIVYKDGSIIRFGEKADGFMIKRKLETIHAL